MAKGMGTSGSFSIEIDSREVVREIVRQHSLAGAIYSDAASAAMQEARKWLDLSTNTWRHKPDIKVKAAPPLITPVYGGIEGDIVDVSMGTTVTIETTSDIFKFVDKGTKAHEILPKGPWPLRFQWGGPGSYKAKTGPGHLGSVQGGPTGGIVFRRGVWHPGTVARDITGKVFKVVEQAWPNLVAKAAKARWK